MPKRKIISTPIKETISQLYKQGQSATQLAKDFNVSRRLIYNIIEFEVKNGTLHRKLKTGRPRKLNIRQERALSRLVMCY